MPTTELQMLQRRAKYLGLRGTGTRDQLIRRIAEAEGIPKEAVLAIVKRDFAANHKKKPGRASVGRRATPHTRKFDRRKERAHRANRYSPDRRANRYSPKRHDYRAGHQAGHRAHRGDPTDNDLIMSYCGEQCFAGKDFPICKKCDSKRCYCEPQCSAIRAAHIRGIDKERMEYYAEVLECPGWKKMEPSFQLEDIVVAVPKIDGKKHPLFGVVTRYTKNGDIEIKILSTLHTELTDILERAYNEGYRVSAKDVYEAENSFAVEPKWSLSGEKPKLVRTNNEGYWDDHRVYFSPYDENKLYLREYSLSDIKRVMSKL